MNIKKDFSSKNFKTTRGKFRKLAATAFILLLAPLLSFAQEGIIKGKVTEKENGKNVPVPFVNIVIAGTTTGAVSDFDGNFSIKVKPGTYTLISSFVGYIQDTINNVRVTAAAETSININMRQDVKELKAVEIAATKVTQTEKAVMMEIRQSDRIVSGISAEQISRSQDRDASQVIKRIPGVTVINDRFVMVRGLQERYNSVLLHDTYAPSMEADIRSFSFDILPGSLIDRILIFKTPSAELPGDFAGGTIKVFTASIPDENKMTFSYQNSFRDGTTFRNFYRPEQSANAWTGFNDGTYNLPSNFPEDLRKVEQGDSDALTKAGRSLRNNWIPEYLKATPDQRLAFSKATRFRLGNITAGNITALTYSRSSQYTSVNRNDYNIYDTINDKSDPIFNFYDDRYVQNIRVGLIHNWAFKFNSRNSIEIKTLLNQNSSGEYIHRSGEAYEFNYFPDNHSFFQEYRGIALGQIAGKHEFSEGKSSFNWVTGLGRSYFDTPDYRRYRSDLDTSTGQSQLYVPAGAAAAFFLGRFFSEMEEISKTASVNYDQKLIFNALPNFDPVISAGVFFEDKSRYFIARNIGYVTSSTSNFNNDLLDVSIDSLFHPLNINESSGIRIDEQSNPSDSYTARNTIAAPYFTTSLPITQKFKVKAGVRIEHNIQRLQSSTLTNIPVEVYNPVTSILPSINLTYKLTEKTVLRGAFGKTVNRPEFRELAPFGFYDFSFNLVKKGNENLQTATIFNYDVRWELYPTENEIISIAAFYKKFHNPIENFFVPGGGSGGIKTFTFGNAVEAYSAGTEIEIRKSLAGLTSNNFFEDLSVLLNTSLIYSRVNLGDDLRQSNNRPLMGQSPYIVNSGLYYSNVAHRFQATLLYNVIGRRIFIIGTDDYPDIYELPRNQIDFTISKSFGKHLQVKAGVSDVLNNEVVLIQDGNSDGKWSRKTDQRIMSFKPGALYSLGFNWTF
jgi:outer membrane receptor for ferrienterochelin and colicin